MFVKSKLSPSTHDCLATDREYFFSINFFRCLEAIDLFSFLFVALHTFFFGCVASIYCPAEVSLCFLFIINQWQHWMYPVRWHGSLKIYELLIHNFPLDNRFRFAASSELIFVMRQEKFTICHGFFLSLDLALGWERRTFSLSMLTSTWETRKFHFFPFVHVSMQKWCRLPWEWIREEIAEKFILWAIERLDSRLLMINEHAMPKSDAKRW